jgi:hypothetical protein
VKVNPYFAAYASAHGRTPDGMRAADEEDWPGGRACGFMLWMSQRWSEWARLRGYRRTASGSNDTYIGPLEEADFAGWLRGTAFAIAETLTSTRSSRDTTNPGAA